MELPPYSVLTYFELGSTWFALVFTCLIRSRRPDLGHGILLTFSTLVFALRKQAASSRMRRVSCGDVACFPPLAAAPLVLLIDRSRPSACVYARRVYAASSIGSFLRLRFPFTTFLA